MNRGHHMRVINFPDAIPGKLLLPLIRWVAKESGPAARTAVIAFLNIPASFSTKRCIVPADSFPHSAAQHGFDMEKHYVRVFAPAELLWHGRYPLVRQLDTGSPRQTLRSWHEELVWTLAHQLFHIQQYEGGWVPGRHRYGDRVCEREAEEHAAKLLEQWRAYQPRYMPGLDDLGKDAD